MQPPVQPARNNALAALPTPRRACTVCTGGGKAKPCASLFGGRKEDESTEEKSMLARNMHGFPARSPQRGSLPHAAEARVKRGTLDINNHIYFVFHPLIFPPLFPPFRHHRQQLSPRLLSAPARSTSCCQPLLHPGVSRHCQPATQL